MTTKRTSDVDTEIGKRVHCHRRRLGLSQSELGEKLGITFQQVQKYERGFNRISAGRLLQMADIFAIPVAALFPHANSDGDQAELAAQDALSEMLITTDGRRLSLAFLKIEDRHVRKTIIALVESLVDTPPKSSESAPK